MEFSIETTYDQRAMTAMARALRKTVRRKRSRRSHTLGAVVIILSSILLWTRNSIDMRWSLTLIAEAAVLIALVWEDSINGYLARKRSLPGLNKSIVVFHDNGYHSKTSMGESDFYYEKILEIAEVGDYIVFMFSASHAQVYDKRTLTGGTTSDFFVFLIQKTDKQIKHV